MWFLQRIWVFRPNWCATKLGSHWGTLCNLNFFHVGMDVSPHAFSPDHCRRVHLPFTTYCLSQAPLFTPFTPSQRVVLIPSCLFTFSSSAFITKLWHEAPRNDDERRYLSSMCALPVCFHGCLLVILWARRSYRCSCTARLRLVGRLVSSYCYRCFLLIPLLFENYQLV